MNSYEVLRRIMFDKRMTKADVIRETGVTRPTLVSWEKGKEPSLRTLRKLADYFEIPVTKFLERS